MMEKCVLPSPRSPILVIARNSGSELVLHRAGRIFGLLGHATLIFQPPQEFS